MTGYSGRTGGGQSSSPSRYSKVKKPARKVSNVSFARSSSFKGGNSVYSSAKSGITKMTRNTNTQCR